jgi:hypothetical protein
MQGLLVKNECRPEKGGFFIAKESMTKISMIQGTSRNVTLTFVESDGVTPIDLTGGTVYLTVNSSNTPSSDSSAAFQKKITSFSAPTTGVQTVSIVPSDTHSLAAGTYYYDAKAITAAGVEVAVPQDSFILKAAITQSIT